MELRHAIAYVNDAVIPQVRKESISAMRTAADSLRNLADRFEQTSRPAANQTESRSPHNDPPQGDSSESAPKEPHT